MNWMHYILDRMLRRQRNGTNREGLPQRFDSFFSPGQQMDAVRRAEQKRLRRALRRLASA